MTVAGKHNSTMFHRDELSRGQGQEPDISTLSRFDSHGSMTNSLYIVAKPYHRSLEGSLAVHSPTENLPPSHVNTLHADMTSSPSSSERSPPRAYFRRSVARRARAS